MADPFVPQATQLPSYLSGHDRAGPKHKQPQTSRKGARRPSAPGWRTVQTQLGPSASVHSHVHRAATFQVRCRGRFPGRIDYCFLV